MATNQLQRNFSPRHAHAPIQVLVSGLKYGRMCSLCTTSLLRWHPVRDGLWSGQKARTRWPATTPAMASCGFDLLLVAHVTMVVCSFLHRPEISFSKAHQGSGFLPHPDTALSGLTVLLSQVTPCDISLSPAKYRAFLVLPLVQTVYTEPAHPFT